MSLWIFKCFVSEDGERDYIDEWYAKLPEKAMGKFDSILEHLRDTPHHQWNPNIVFPLTGYDGIFEIRFRIRNILYRPLGYFGPDRHDFTFLIGAREHGDRFEPKNAPEIAAERRGIILNNKERACECKF